MLRPDATRTHPDRAQRPHRAAAVELPPHRGDPRRTADSSIADADRRYRVGTTLWTIAQHAPLSDRLRESALPALARLYEETGENITLAVLDRGQALYVERLMGERSIPTVSRAGGHLPLHTTGVGKVLLGYQPPRKSRSTCREPLARPTRDSIVNPNRLRRELGLGARPRLRDHPAGDDGGQRLDRRADHARRASVSPRWE